MKTGRHAEVIFEGLRGRVITGGFVNLFFQSLRVARWTSNCNDPSYFR